MLRFKKLLIWFKLWIAHLNTSHVKVQDTPFSLSILLMYDLNTSHVKVQAFWKLNLIVPVPHLNTSHVKVQELLI